MTSTTAGQQIEIREERREKKKTERERERQTKKEERKKERKKERKRAIPHTGREVWSLVSLDKN
jgi:hypothetical protein